MPAGLSPGAHRLTYRNTHRPDIGVYLANALVPRSNRVAVTGQDRDFDQRELTIAFELVAEHGRGALLVAVAAFGALCAGLALWVRKGGRRLRQPLKFPTG
jgi:hypothetical protein